MKTNWITQKQAQEAASQGELSALKCSLEHHQQGRDADYVELKEAIAGECFSVEGEFCACCQRKNLNKKRFCPLGNIDGDCNGEHCCEGFWGKTRNKINMLECAYTNANSKAFQEAEAEVCKYIEGVIEKVEKKEKCDKAKKDKPKIQLGDYGTEDKGDRSIGNIIFLQNNGELTAYWLKDMSFSCHPISYFESKFVKVGNIIDDLQANSEPLREFEIEYDGKRCVPLAEVKMITPDEINFRFMSAESTYNLGCIKQLHQKLGRLIAAMQKENDKG